MKEKLIKQLQSYLSLEKGWDSYDADKIDEIVISNAIYLLNRLNHLPEIYPTVRNSVQFEFENSDNDYMEIEIFKDKVRVFIQYNNNKEDEFISDIYTVSGNVDIFFMQSTISNE